MPEKFKELIIDKRVSDEHLFHAITTYISNRLKKEFDRIKKRSFINFRVFLSKLPIEILGAKIELEIYRGIRLDYYRIWRQEYIISVAPAYKFIMKPNLNTIIRQIVKNLHRRKDRSWEDIKERILERFKDVDLSTVHEYWSQELGPVDAGSLQDILSPKDLQYNEKYNKIKKYYMEKSECHRHFIEKHLSIVQKPYIVITERRWHGKLSKVDYFASILNITPSMENLSEFLTRKDLDWIHKELRPRNPYALYKKYEDALHRFITLLEKSPVITVERIKKIG